MEKLHMCRSLSLKAEQPQSPGLQFQRTDQRAEATYCTVLHCTVYAAQRVLT